MLTDKNDSSLWKKGEQVIKNHKDILRMRGRLTRVVKVMTPFITLANKTKLINNKKFSKFKSEPYKFICDSKSTLAKSILNKYILK